MSSTPIREKRADFGLFLDLEADNTLPSHVLENTILVLDSCSSSAGTIYDLSSLLKELVPVNPMLSELKINDARKALL